MSGQLDAVKVIDDQEATPPVEENSITNLNDFQSITFSPEELPTVAEQGEKSLNIPTEPARSEDIYESLLQI